MRQFEFYATTIKIFSYKIIVQFLCIAEQRKTISNFETFVLHVNKHILLP